MTSEISVGASGGPVAFGRRSFLNRILGVWLVSVAGSILYPIVRFLVPPDIPEAATRSVDGGKASTLLVNSGRLVPFGSAPAIIVRTSAGDYRAFAATCTHLACTVQYRPDLQNLWCACHDGRFDLNGRNIAGPPPKPLESYQVNVRDDQIVVSKRT